MKSSATKSQACSHSMHQPRTASFLGGELPKTWEHSFAANVRVYFQASMPRPKVGVNGTPACCLHCDDHGPTLQSTTSQPVRSSPCLMPENIHTCQSLNPNRSMHQAKLFACKVLSLVPNMIHGSKFSGANMISKTERSKAWR